MPTIRLRKTSLLRILKKNMILSVFVVFLFGHVYIDDEEDLLSEEEEEETKDHSTTFQERMCC